MNWGAVDFFMTAKEIIAQLKPLGKESYRRVLTQNHGVREPVFGVAISELKQFQKRLKRDYQLALDLYASGNYDAMYLAGLISDDARMTPQDLQRWAEQAHGGALAGATVAWVAAGSPHGWTMARQWIESSQTSVAVAGWATISSLVSIQPDEQLDLAELKRLLERIARDIRQAPDAVRYQMNLCLIAVGSYVKPLTDFALQLGERLGRIEADLGKNDCQMPFAPDYIRKVEQRGSLGKKRKSAKC